LAEPFHRLREHQSIVEPVTDGLYDAPALGASVLLDHDLERFGQRQARAEQRDEFLAERDDVEPWRRAAPLQTADALGPRRQHGGARSGSEAQGRRFVFGLERLRDDTATGPERADLESHALPTSS